MYFTYILQSETTGKLYIGHTNNLEDRLKRHNNAESKSTKSGVPWKMIFIKSFNTRSEAATLESKIKRFKNREYILKWINDTVYERPDEIGKVVGSNPITPTE